MKKVRINLSKNQREGAVRNFSSMSVKTQRKYAPLIIMMALVTRAIKGKLGIDMRTSDGTFLFTGRAIFDALTANAGGFYTPAFSGLATIGTQATAFEDAINAFMLGGLGTEAAKTEAKQALKITLIAALAYINNLAFHNQPRASEIILGAAMQIVRVGSINKQDFAVKQGPGTGEVVLNSLAAKIEGKRVKAIYDWQYSTDNGVTWVTLDSTVVSKTKIADMTVNLRTFFRKRTTTVKGGTSAWCEPIAITLV